MKKTLILAGILGFSISPAAFANSAENLVRQKYSNEIVNFVLNRSTDDHRAVECLADLRPNIWDVKTIIVGQGGMEEVRFQNADLRKIYKIQMNTITEQAIRKSLSKKGIGEVHKISVVSAKDVHPSKIENETTLKVTVSYNIAVKDEMTDFWIINSYVYGPSTDKYMSFPQFAGKKNIEIPLNNPPDNEQVSAELSALWDSSIRTCISEFGPF